MCGCALFSYNYCGHLEANPCGAPMAAETAADIINKNKRKGSDASDITVKPYSSRASSLAEPGSGIVGGGNDGKRDSNGSIKDPGFGAIGTPAKPGNGSNLQKNKRIGPRGSTTGPLEVPKYAYGCNGLPAAKVVDDWCPSCYRRSWES